MTYVLEAKKLKKSFKTPLDITILNNVDLTVSSGETVAIMGRSGEGKSTLLQIFGTLEKSDAGSIVISGIEVSPFTVTNIRRNHLAFVFQSYHLLEDYSVLENILMPARIHREASHKGSLAYQRALELLELVGLSKRAFFDAKLLSGGEKQRVAIARALMNDPDLILADEPSGNLDKVSAESIHQLLLDFTKEKKKALVLVTHDEKLAALCDTQYTLDKGSLLTSSSIVV